MNALCPAQEGRAILCASQTAGLGTGNQPCRQGPVNQIVKATYPILRVVCTALLHGVDRIERGVSGYEGQSAKVYWASTCNFFEPGTFVLHEKVMGENCLQTLRVESKGFSVTARLSGWSSSKTGRGPQLVNGDHLE